MKSTRLNVMARIAFATLSVNQVYYCRQTSAEDRDESRRIADSSTELSAAFQKAAEKVQPSLVTIKFYSGPRETADWAKRLTAPNRSKSGPHELQVQEVAGAQDGEGTGIIIDPSGYILTCSHVVDDADMLFVSLQDGRRFEVRKVLQDSYTDVAVVQIEGAGPLPAAKLATTDNLHVGDWVVTIGNPYGLGISLSGGIVSATRRHVKHIPYAPLIQTDAATNPGNSGGALVDLRGTVVGMSEGGYGIHEGFQGIGFAIPIALAAEIARELIETGTVTRPIFGLETEEVTVEMARHLGAATSSGLIVCDVAKSSPAAQAGVQVGDVLTHVGNSAIEDHFQFFELVKDEAPLTPITFTVLRAGAPIKVEVLPEALPPKHRSASTQLPSRPPSEYFDDELGLALEDFSSQTAKQLGFREPVEGVLLTYVDPDGSAAKRGICAGMTLLRIDDRPVRNTNDYRDAIRESDISNGVLLLIGTSRAKHFILCRD